MANMKFGLTQAKIHIWLNSYFAKPLLNEILVKLKLGKIMVKHWFKFINK
jgi:hypothetical protein